ncbi:MAG TPA: hypothetical protein VMM36_18320 [Opitutaceae bacterium]|nr:hypothetical protein [Opitutaceae bacterium]
MRFFISGSPIPRLPVCLVLLGLVACGAVAQTPPVVRVTGVTPDPGSMLARGQNIYVRVAYESDQPLRFQAAGYFEESRHDKLAMNPSAVHPAGSGEALVWVFAHDDTRIDEIHVRVFDASWKELFAVPASAPVEWRAGATEASTAPWAAELAAAQQRAVSEAMKAEPEPSTALGKLWSVIVTLLVPLAFLSLPAYPLFQVYALWKLRGMTRLLSALPLVFMLPIYAYSFFALSKGSNLWPLFAIFASPVALIIVIVVMVIARRRAAEEELGSRV